MIQRAQTIYLGLACICMVLLLFFPIFSIEITGADESEKIAGVLGADGFSIKSGVLISMPLKYIYIVLALFSLAGILLYKKRPRQLLVCRLNFVLHILFVVGIYIFYFFGKPFVVDGIAILSEVESTTVFYMQVGFFLLIPTVAFIYLAIRGIKRDENLVNSLDRLR